jgi:serine/threonine protein kinase
METATVILHDGRQVDVRFRTPQIGEGGCKTVFLTEDGQSVIGFYKPEVIDVMDPNRFARLQSVLTKFNPTLPQSDGGLAIDEDDAKRWAKFFCWPTGIVVYPMLGVMMPTYPTNFKFSDGRFKGKDKEGKWFSSPKLRKMLPASELGTWLDYLLICGRIARAALKMHMVGIAHSDFSSKNVLVDPSSGAACSVIDLDSAVVRGVFPPDVAGTPNYIAPEVLRTLQMDRNDPAKALASQQTDLHALGVLFYEYLLRRHPLRGPKINSPVSAEEDDRLSMGEKALFIEHPHDHSNRPKGLQVLCAHLGPMLEKQFNKCFVAGLHEPRLRPTAASWDDAVRKTVDVLLPCGNPQCPEKWFVYCPASAKVACPWCGWKMTARIPLLHFYSSRIPGQYIAEGYGITGWNRRTLNEWHISANISPNATVTPSVMAEVCHHHGKWLLVNRRLHDMVSASGKPVAIDQAVELVEGNEYHLSQEPRGRMVRVEFVG